MTPTPVLPSLPEPAGIVIVNCSAMRAFTADQMDEHARRAIESLSRAPIDMVLHCPACGAQHIDAPEASSQPDGMFEGDEGWDNPPHRSHLCAGCGHIWRPADVPTNGVAAAKTTGKADSPIASHSTKRAGPVPAEIVRKLIEALRAFVEPQYQGGVDNNAALIRKARAAIKLGESHEG